ncbi:MAG: fibronectin type III domain-containing protein [Chitinispirillaceae bacterium]|nr:fibronectin type III domain-containing protein [Chitinispirillaceae bacterium]
MTFKHGISFSPLTLILFCWVLPGFKTNTTAGAPPEYYYPDPDIATNGVVRTVLFYGDKLYIGGNFTEVTDKNGTYDRTDLAAYDAATWRVTDFKANTNRGTVRAIVAGNGRLFAGGTFTKINGEPRSRVAALDTATGAVITGFRNKGSAIDGEVWALALSKTALYVGGSFIAVDGYARNNLASLNIDNGAVDQRFDPAPCDPFNDSGRTPGGVYALKVHPNDSTIVFVAGNFRAIAGVTDRAFLVALNADGTPGPEFENRQSHPVVALDADGPLLCAGVGGFSNRVVAYGIGNDPYVRYWKGPTAEGDVQAVACAREGYVYFGFHQGLFDSTDNFRLAVLDANTGDLHDAYPSMNSFFGVRALDVTDSCLAVGGEFTRMNGLRQKYLAVFRTLPYPPAMINAPAPPELSSPDDEAAGIPVAPVLEWKWGARASTYEVQLATDPQFTNTVLQANGLTGNSHYCTGLGHTTPYWWRVRARNKGGASDWSEFREFITVPGKNDIPAVAYPADGTTGQPVAFEFRWHPTASALSYGIQLLDALNDARTIIDREGISDTSFTIAGLTNNTTYCWRVNARTAGGTTGWRSAGFQTVVAGPAGAPRCIAPVNNAAQVVPQPALRWENAAGAVWYRVQVSADPGFQAIVCDTAVLTDTSITVRGLAEGARYFWRVNAGNAGGGVWSLPMRFTTLFPLPCAPLPVAPAAGSMATSDTLHLVWNKSTPHVTKYLIEIARDSSMSAALVDTMAADTESIRYGLAYRTRFWWRVRAGNETGWGACSETQSFTTAFFAVKQLQFSLYRFAFYGRKGSITYSVAQQCDVHIELIDLKGNCVWKASWKNRGPGVYREQFPSWGFPAGTYLLSFTAGKFVTTADATLVR